MRSQRVVWIMSVPLMRSSGGTSPPAQLGSRRPHLLALPLSHLAESGAFRSFLSNGCFPALKCLVDKFAMLWAYVEGTSEWARRRVTVP